ncbi:alpha/beta hydrolase fold family protein [Mycobacterium kansasii 732]|nr:alpha/beta hydrolase fold family protein [Mycobacterium kansasii 732]VAZ94132.1 Carboxylesterase NlhH [Mycobacterium pseudokansasii]VAZ95077.1 Carboxylesterase NlhH [Mycobacterium pseudokansasii]
MPSFTENAAAPILDTEVIEAFLSWYVPEPDLSDHITLPATPAPANGDLSGLPPAFVRTAAHDPLRDHGARYAELLNAAGVAAQWCNEPNMVHGYVNLRWWCPPRPRPPAAGWLR